MAAAVVMACGLAAPAAAKVAAVMDNAHPNLGYVRNNFTAHLDLSHRQLPVHDRP